MHGKELVLPLVHAGGMGSLTVAEPEGRRVLLFLLTADGVGGLVKVEPGQEKLYFGDRVRVLEVMPGAVVIEAELREAGAAHERDIMTRWGPGRVRLELEED